MPDIKDCIAGRCLHTVCKNSPGPEDIKLGQRLVAEGWRSVSHKYRHIVRWRIPPPPAIEMLRPEVIDTFHGQAMIELWERRRMDNTNLRMQCGRRNEAIEERTLTLQQWIAFRGAGGTSA